MKPILEFVYEGVKYFSFNGRYFLESSKGKLTPIEVRHFKYMLNEYFKYN